MIITIKNRQNQIKKFPKNSTTLIQKNKPKPPLLKPSSIVIEKKKRANFLKFSNYG